jgi:hypothetical protein
MAWPPGMHRSHQEVTARERRKYAVERHRFLEEAPHVRLPRPPAPEPTPVGFVLCPVPGPLWSWQLALYQWAFEEARKVARPSLPERDLLAVWN